MAVAARDTGGRERGPREGAGTEGGREGDDALLHRSRSVRVRPSVPLQISPRAAEDGADYWMGSEANVSERHLDSSENRCPTDVDLM